MSGNAIRFYLDGNEYDSPENWRDINVEISLDNTSQIVAIDYTTELVWHGSAYSYLYNKAINDNCGLVNVRIDVDSDNETHVVNGVLFLSGITFNETKAIATGKIEDNAYSARIQNNTSTQVFFGSQTSKNGVAINHVPVSRSVFKPSDGVYYTDYVQGVTPFRAFEFLIDWMTDKTVNVKSDYFETGAGANYLITTAANLQTLGFNANAPTFSFRQLYNTMRALFNIGMGFQQLPDAFGELKPTVVIEPLDFFRNTTDQVIIDDVHTTELSFVQDLLYGRIQIGGEITQVYSCDNGNTNCNAFTNVFWYGFDSEVYPISGTCNRDTALELTVDSKFVIDTNTIQDIIEFDSQAHNKKAILIEIFDGSLLASMSDPLELSTVQRWYNGALTNRNVVARYIDYLNNSISVYGLNTVNNQFNVTKTGVYQFQECLVQTPAWVYSGTMPFDTGTPLPQYINNDCFDLATNRFVPTFEGIFKFEFQYSAEDDVLPATCPISGGANVIYWQLQIKQYNASGVFITDHVSPSMSSSAGFSGTFVWTTTYISMDDGDYLEMHAKANMALPPATHQNAFGIINGTWRTIEAYTVEVQGETATGTKATPKVTATNAHLPMDTVFSYLNDTTKTIRLSNQYIGNRDGHVERVSVNLYTGQSEISINHG
jgi:hypothetical protein